MLPTSRFMYHINHKERRQYLGLYIIWLIEKDQQADCKNNKQKIFAAYIVSRPENLTCVLLHKNT
jgi:hypothetical protein